MSSTSSLFVLPFSWLRSASTHRLFWLGGPLLLYCWTINGPFLGDDLNILLRAEHYLHGESHTKSPDLYRFAQSDEDWRALRDRGTAPWWLPDSGRLDFFRPISEWMFYLDVRLFGRHPLGYRLNSLIVFGIALIALHWMFLAAGGDPIRAGVATFLFGISQTATPPATWICNRQDLYVVIGVALASTAYWSSWKRPRRWHMALAVSGFIFALLSKEVAVALGGVVVCHEVFMRQRADPDHQKIAARRIALLFLITTVCYLSYYVYSRPWVLDFSGSDGIPNQLGARLHLAFPLYAAVWTIGFPIDVISANGPLLESIVAIAGCLLGLIVIYYLRKSIRGDRAALFFILWSVLFLLPGLRAMAASTRTLCVPTAGWVYLLAGLIVPTREDQLTVPSLLRHWLWAANGIVSVGCAIGTVLYMNHVEVDARQRMDRAIGSLETPLRDGDSLIFQKAESSIELICGGDRLEYLSGRRGLALAYLLAPGINAAVRAEDDHTLLMTAKNGENLFGTAIHRLTLGPRWKPKVGDVFHHQAFTAEITKVGNDSTVTAMRFRFNRPFDSPRLHFFPSLRTASTQASPLSMMTK